MLRAAVGVFLAAALLPAAEKLTDEQRIDLIRGLSSEYATAKVQIPHSKKDLEFGADGKYDKAEWDDATSEHGVAARVGDLVQITKVEIRSDRLVLEINKGFKGGRHWYERIQVSTNGGSATPISQGQSTALAGTTIQLLFHRDIPSISAAEVKKLLAPVLDFEKRSAAETYVETLPPEVQEAIKEKRAVAGMNREQVLLALGKPIRKVRETKDGVETEDWIYGNPPGKIVFVTFEGDKATKVKETYAGLGSEAQTPPAPR